MKPSIFIAAVLVTAASPCASFAGVYGDDLSKCLIRSANSDDQIVLMQWLFSAMSANPSLASMVRVTAENRETYNKNAAALYGRLMLHDCRREVVAGMKYEGSSAVEQGFGSLGNVAGRSIMSAPAATAELAKLNQYVDQKEFEQLEAEAKADSSTVKP